MVHQSTIISTSDYYTRICVRVLWATLMLLPISCGMRPGVGPVSDGGILYDGAVLEDADQPEYKCLEVLESAPCTADWSVCRSVNVRMLSDQLYIHKRIAPIGLSIRNTIAFENQWYGCFKEDHTYHPPDIPQVDFSEEMVIWHFAYNDDAVNGLEPEVWECGGCLVFVPVVSSFGGELGSWVWTAVVIPSMDASIQFEEPLSL